MKKIIIFLILFLSLKAYSQNVCGYQFRDNIEEGFIRKNTTLGGFDGVLSVVPDKDKKIMRFSFVTQNNYIDHESFIKWVNFAYDIEMKLVSKAQGQLVYSSFVDKDIYLINIWLDKSGSTVLTFNIMDIAWADKITNNYNDLMFKKNGVQKYYTIYPIVNLKGENLFFHQ